MNRKNSSLFSIETNWSKYISSYFGLGQFDHIKPNENDLWSFSLRGFRFSFYARIWIFLFEVQDIEFSPLTVFFFLELISFSLLLLFQITGFQLTQHRMKHFLTFEEILLAPKNFCQLFIEENSVSNPATDFDFEKIGIIFLHWDFFKFVVVKLFILMF